MIPKTVLSVEDLKVEIPDRKGNYEAVRGVSFDLHEGEVLGIVGESGAGKSLTGCAIINLLDTPARISGGRVLYQDTELQSLSAQELRRIRGPEIGMIFQDPLTSLDPLFTIGDQLTETLLAHQDVSKDQAKSRALELLQEVGIAAAQERFHQYPHQFSGGMRQRVVIALALANDPKVIIADEPTTALDVSVQAQINSLMKQLAKSHKTAIILITHDMGVIAEIADRVAVMYAGRIVEIGPVDQVVSIPQHPYTQGLMASIPVLGQKQDRLRNIPGAMPSPQSVPRGCAFHERCAYVYDVCREDRPELEEIGASRAACWLVRQRLQPNQPVPQGDGEVQ